LYSFQGTKLKEEKLNGNREQTSDKHQQQPTPKQLFAPLLLTGQDPITKS
jgi:hypothetical protein